MAKIITLIILVDSLIMPVYGWIAGGSFLVITLLIFLLIHRYKELFYMAMILIIIATTIFLFGRDMVEESVIRKLSDWTLILLIYGAIKLWIYEKNI